MVEPLITVTCNDGPHHKERGERNIIGFWELPDPGLDGCRWREVPMRANKEYEDPIIGLVGRYRDRKETVFTPDGEMLTGARAGRTRSRGAAETAGYDPEPLIGSILHFELPCPTCGLQVSVKGETLDPILDKLLAAGQVEVSLKMLQLAIHRVAN